jgi:hypothetical protein
VELEFRRIVERQGESAMAMGRSGAVQDDLMATWAEMPRSPGHAFYDRLQEVLRDADFDGFVEGVCKPYYAPRMGAPSMPPGRYFRMHMIGYFEGIDSERGIAWRCADSFCCAISCGSRTVTRSPIIRGCRARARACRTRRTSRCSAGS